MSNQQKEISEIKEYIKKWIYEIEISNSLNYFDINKVAEGVCLRLLNLIYKYNLKDLNKEKINFPGVDLGNTVSSKIAFQITSESSANKIKKTLKTFEEFELSKKFTNGVRFLILSTKKKKFSKIEGSEEIFDQSKDILFVSDLISEIEAIFWDDNVRFNKIKRFLEIEFGNRGSNQTAVHADCDALIKNFTDAAKANLPSPDGIVYIFLGEDQIHYDVRKLFGLPFNKQGKIILGRSGCGKSLLAKAWALNNSDEMVPLILQAKYFDTGLIRMIEDEVIKNGFNSASDFFEICNSAGKKIFLVLDGINECDSSKATVLLSQLADISNKQEMLFIITAQDHIADFESLEVDFLRMALPDIEIKAAIASKYSNYSEKLMPVLANVSTAQEAKMVGEIGEFGADRISRFSLFELYVRKKLAAFETQAMFLLSLAADWMSREINFSISLRQLNIIMQENNISDLVLDRCLKEHILVRDFTKVSFEHEMILNFFTADAVIRFSNEAEELISEFNAPRNDEKRLLIIGAVEEPVVRNSLLDSITDIALIQEIIKGEAGEYCSNWAEESIGRVIEKLRLDAEGIFFILTADEYFPIEATSVSEVNWTNSDKLFLQVLAFKLSEAEHLQEVLSIIGIVENRIKEYYKALFEEAREKKVNLKNGLFAAVYVSFRNYETVPAISQLFNLVNSGLFALDNEPKIEDQKIRQQLPSEITAGQLYFLLHLLRINLSPGILYPIIHQALTASWNIIPYHLKVEVLFIVSHCASDGMQQQALISALEKIHRETRNGWISTLVLEALADLDALDEDTESHKESVKSEISKLLEEPEAEESWREAFNLYSNQFDHPYNRAYFESLQELDEASKRIFYSMAVRSYSENTLFVPGLIFMSEQLLGKGCCKYLLHYLDKPQSGSVLRYEKVKTWIAAYVVLGRYNYEIENIAARDCEPELLHAGTKLFYWINRTNISEQEIRKNCAPIFQLLFENEALFRVYLLKNLQFSYYQTHFPVRFYENENTSIKGIYDLFPDKLLEACRKSVADPVAGNARYGFDSADTIIRYAIDKIGDYGNAVDLPLLQQAAGNLVFGKNAVAAIKQIKAGL
ncbi:SMEK domain-containing protein [Flavobacterium sp. LC2016-01]|uniref:SMEK domain-containing protein n=1 Tax=Flavobacterium sp. LC2016-01 TaxID=2675876 RepID=UPI0012BAFCA8|nr:SMEK domain-containing protein [Flavobacterium sp. LC2016-01]MTH15888.1 SMEK domain-containing protein [Flavobacterium sp. LC2016-01]